MANVFYNAGKQAINNQGIDFLNDDIYVMMVTSSYTPDKDADEDRADVTNEISGTGYTAGGQVLVNKAINRDDANDRSEADADDPSWASSTITDARGAIYYKSTGVAANDILICYQDFGADFSTVNETFIIELGEAIYYLGE